MRHARTEALDQLEEVLAALRTLASIRERTRGVFYLRGQAFTHFHEDPSGLYADLRRNAEFDRFPVNTIQERSNYLAAVRQILG